MIGRSGAVCPGGRAMAHWVGTPRAADMKNPDEYVGAADDGAAVPNA
jgi:hypothetical protein